MRRESFNEAVKSGNLNPLMQDRVVITSYQFARNKEAYVRQTPWDLVVIDEAHRLRNVYKPSSKIAAAIKEALKAYPKLLLTATPLQNSLLELFGLVSIIDDYAFGDLDSFKSQYSRLTTDEDFAHLKRRMEPILKRTLRKQVLEYVRYTNRHAIVQEFIPTEEEQRLYDLVSGYLQQGELVRTPREPAPTRHADPPQAPCLIDVRDCWNPRRPRSKAGRSRRRGRPRRPSRLRS